MVSACPFPQRDYLSPGLMIEDIGITSPPRILGKICCNFYMKSHVSAINPQILIIQFFF